MSIKKLILVNKAVTDSYKHAPRLIGGLSVRFFKDRFVRQGWQDEGFEKWPKRKREDRRTKKAGNRAVLVKTGRLKRSIKVLSRSATRLVVGTTVPYAYAHNEGFNGTVNVKSHNRGVEFETKKTSYKTRTGKERTRKERIVTKTTKVKAHQRKVNLPKRRFIGNSKLLNRRIEKNIEYELKNELKKIR